MIEVRHAELNALFGFAERQMHVIKRYWVWEVVWLFYSLVSVLSIGFLASGLGALGVVGASFDLDRAQLYLLVGALLWGYLSLVFMEAAYAISWERWEGTIEYTFMAPVRRVTHLFGICFFAIGYGLARTFAVLLIATLMFRLDFSHADIHAHVPARLLACRHFGGAGGACGLDGTADRPEHPDRGPALALAAER